MGRKAWRSAQRSKEAEKRSLLEDRVALLLPDVPYEELTIAYRIEHKYNPDFHYDTPTTRYLVEVKGWFRDKPEASKYKWIKESIDTMRTSDGRPIKLLFVFADPTKKAYNGLRRRKDGTIFSMGEWATKHGFWYCHERAAAKILELP